MTPRFRFRQYVDSGAGGVYLDDAIVDIRRDYWFGIESDLCGIDSVGVIWESIGLPENKNTMFETGKLPAGFK
jgi:hypothetical protein